jgi:ATP-dependent DNA ligase
MQMYPAVAAAGRRLQAAQAVIDGEIVAVDEHGRPPFQALQRLIRSWPTESQVVHDCGDLCQASGV